MEANKYNLFKVGDLVVGLHGEAHLIYVVVSIPHTAGRHPYQHNVAMLEQVMDRHLKPSKNSRTRLNKRVASYKLGKGTASRYTLMEDYIEACRKSVEDFTPIFMDHYANISKDNMPLEQLAK